MSCPLTSQMGIASSRVARLGFAAMPLEDEADNGRHTLESLRFLMMFEVSGTIYLRELLWIFDDIWWYLMIFDDIWWYLMIFDDIWWYLMIFDDIWWYLMIFDDIWWYLMIFGIWHVTVRAFFLSENHGRIFLAGFDQSLPDFLPIPATWTPVDLCKKRRSSRRFMTSPIGRSLDEHFTKQRCFPQRCFALMQKIDRIPYFSGISWTKKTNSRLQVSLFSKQIPFWRVTWDRIARQVPLKKDREEAEAQIGTAMSCPFLRMGHHPRLGVYTLW